MRGICIMGLLAGTLAMPAAAETGTVLASAVFSEQVIPGSGSTSDRVIERGASFHKGDRVVLMVEWRAASDGKAFAVTSAVPATLAFEQSSRDNLEVSLDGGRNWGRLGMLKITDRWGTRLAGPQDVTNLRWQIGAREAAQGSGRIAYSAIVR